MIRLAKDAELVDFVGRRPWVVEQLAHLLRQLPLIEVGLVQNGQICLASPRKQVARFAQLL